MAVHLDPNKGEINFLGEKSDFDERWQNIENDFYPEIAAVSKVY